MGCSISGYSKRSTCEAAGGVWTESLGTKEYAYYIKGNKVAIVQKDWTFSGGQTLSQPGLNDLGAQGALLWKSPKESITDGLELQYVYSPQYMLGANHTINTNKFFINGWTVIGGYLTFLSWSAAGVDWTASPYSAVTSGSSGNTGGQTLDYIVVRGSERWNGLHRVQTAGTEGSLITYTKVNEVLPYWEDQQVDFTTDEEIYDGGAGTLYLADHFSAGDYVFMSGSNATASNGLFLVDSVTSSNTAASSKVKFSKVHLIDTSALLPDTDLEAEVIMDIGFISSTDQADINIYKAYRDFSYILTDVNVLNDESDELDIPRYLANGIVYYVKAKYAEDVGDIEKKEYFMREFRRITEKHQSAKKMGTYITQGLSLLRS